MEKDADGFYTAPTAGAYIGGVCGLRRPIQDFDTAAPKSEAATKVATPNDAPAGMSHATTIMERGEHEHPKQPRPQMRQQT
jgi:hypothetical protein